MRVIARLDVKNEWVIKGIQMEGLRKVGAPVELAQTPTTRPAYTSSFSWMRWQVSTTATICSTLSKKPVRTSSFRSASAEACALFEDVSDALSAGADKVAINTGAVNNLSLVSEIANRFGSQCIIGSIEAKRQPGGSWQAYIDNGREPTGLDILEWAQKLETAGVGELLLTSVDQDGTRRGFDH